ncbi:hypothetical protein JCM10212_002168 [Sporobolomyces blumeae]
MAIQNQLTFLLLLLEIATFAILIVPLPFTWRRALFKTIAESQLIAKVQYGLKITFIFVALLFVDAVNQMLKIQREKEVMHEQGNVQTDLRSQTDYRSRKFLAERNFYLHGFTLFLSLILSRVYSLVLDLIKAQEDLAVLKAQKGDVAAAKAAPSGPADRVDAKQQKVKAVSVDKKTE